MSGALTQTAGKKEGYSEDGTHKFSGKVRSWLGRDRARTQGPPGSERGLGSGNAKDHKGREQRLGGMRDGVMGAHSEHSGHGAMLWA